MLIPKTYPSMLGADAPGHEQRAFKYSWMGNLSRLEGSDQGFQLLGSL